MEFLNKNTGEAEQIEDFNVPSAPILQKPVRPTFKIIVTPTSIIDAMRQGIISYDQGIERLAKTKQFRLQTRKAIAMAVVETLFSD